MATRPRSVHAAHEDFLGGGAVDARVRGLVAASWHRSATAGVDSEASLAPITLDDHLLREYRRAHPLSNVFALLYDVLGRAAEECDSLMAVGDAEGQLLWVCGKPATIALGERINFVEGASWDERVAGTNAPGTALRLDEPVQILGAEHFARPVQRWSCAAAPIHDPQTRNILGFVDVTGGRAVDVPQTMAMVRAAARMAEAELGRLAAIGRPPRFAEPALTIEALGRPDCQVDDGQRTLRLSPRHSEIIAILAEQPDGCTADQLAIELYNDDVQSSTLRAEMSRLRSLLGPELLESRPYRLRVPVGCDWLAVEEHLAAGRLRDALRAYRGPLLPQSEAPGVVRRRQRLELHLRAAVMASCQSDLMVTWTRSRWGADDLEMWERQARLLPPQSPLRPLAVAEVARLRTEFGLVRR